MRQYDSKLNIYYDKKEQTGNSMVYVVAPNITEEERQKRLEDVKHVMSTILHCEVDIGCNK